MQTNNISFGSSSLKFLKSQNVVKCAWCGQPVLSERKLASALFNALQVKKGDELAATLDAYFVQFQPERIPNPLLTIYQMAKDPKYREQTFKNLAYHISDKRIDYTNIRATIKNLFADIVMSLDHIIPKFEGGANSQYNYLPMHAFCNNSRKCMPYSEMMNENPAFVDNIRESINLIKEAVKKKKLRVVPDYFQHLLENLEHQGLPKSVFEDLRF